ncbi:hypothetical protein [Micromonospora sp. DT231]|uniref:hypothetical protein n=1 Tax=Micromonospora sp. DT231 TaxID=3416526 RepID=UPI003CEA447A
MIPPVEKSAHENGVDTMIKRRRGLRFLAVFALTLPILLAVLRDGDLDGGTWATALVIAFVLGAAFASIGGQEATPSPHPRVAARIFRSRT